MRPCSVVLCFVLSAAPIPTINAQALNPAVFLEQAQTASLAGKTVTSLKLSATAEWIAGSTHETGTAQLIANVDGSSGVQLNLDKASRMEAQTKSDQAKTCQWADASGRTHDVTGLNCLVAIPWFAPSLFAKAQAQLPAMLTASSVAPVMKDGVALQQISYRLGLKGANDAATKRLQEGTAVKVSFDSKTSLPSSLEYAIHPDGNDLKSIEVKVLFSDYRPTDGVMLPFHIEKYVQRTLQLKLDITNATIE